LFFFGHSGFRHDTSCIVENGVNHHSPNPLYNVFMFLIGCVTTAEGSALVKLGNTTIMCGIKAVSRHYTCSEYGGGVRNICITVHNIEEIFL